MAQPTPSLSQLQAAFKSYAFPANCTVCHTSGELLAGNLKQCSRCGAASYCSTKCQKKDWGSHKVLCAQYMDFKLTRPDDLHRIAILFPGDEDKPKLIWIKFEPKIDLNDNELSVLAKVDFLDHLRASLQLVRRMIHNDMCTTSDDETHSKPGRTIYGFHSELHGYALQDHDQPVNASMAAMIGGKDAVFLEPAFEFPTSGAHGAVDEQFGKWRGPVIITKRDNLIATIFPDPKAQGMIEVGEGEGKRKFKLKVDVMNGGLVEDVNLYDFALIVKQLINPSGLPFLSHLEEGSTMGVKELCATVLRSLSI